jgi:hypothetical protein
LYARAVTNKEVMSGLLTEIKLEYFKTHWVITEMSVGYDEKNKLQGRRPQTKESQKRGRWKEDHILLVVSTIYPESAELLVSRLQFSSLLHSLPIVMDNQR